MRPSDHFLALADQCLPAGPARKAQIIAEAEQHAALAVRTLQQGTARELCASGQLCISDDAWVDLRESLAEILLWVLRFGLERAWLDRTINQWSTAQREMLERLAAKRSQIEELFGRHAGRLVAVHAELSHRHRGGRYVSALDFASGLRLVYKPRSVEIEAWYGSLVEQINAAAPPVSLSAPRILDCGDHGWVEFVEHRACRDREELRRFYRNSGGLLCLLHLLQASDIHYDNLVARGAEPVIVDAETLLQPPLHASAASVLRTAVIPVPGLPDADFSALGFVRSRSLTFPVNARCGAPVLRLCPAANVPFKDTPEDFAPEYFTAEQAEGFRSMWNWAADHRPLLLGLLEQARGMEIRYVVRDTHDYYLALVRAMFDGNPGKATLPALTGERAALAPLLAEELDALAHLDLPHFTLRADELSFEAAEQVFASSGYESARSLIEAMNGEELDRQLRHLESAWQLYAATRRLLCPLRG